MNIENPIYLGDAVYGTYNEELGEIVLTTGHHLPAHASNIIVMDSPTYANFKAWAESIEKALHE